MKSLFRSYICIAKVKIFKCRVKLQGQDYKMKNDGTVLKILSKGISMWNMKTLHLLVQKLLPRLSFSKEGQTSKSR